MTTVSKLMIGVAAGAILGVLYAPDRGSATRRKLARAGEDLKERFNSIKGDISDTIDRVNEDTDDYVYQQNIQTANEITATPQSWQ